MKNFTKNFKLFHQFHHTLNFLFFSEFFYFDIDFNYRIVDIVIVKVLVNINVEVLMINC